ncbi:MAG: GNAT family N-acetyltransferase [Acidobacteriota bacterium]|nr:GNAT family N-acetyltransferase [Acidobacteriota bacterium]
MSSKAERLPPEDVDQVVEVMGDAFLTYPVMRFVVGDEGDIDARVRRLVELFVRRRIMRGGPAFGVPDPDATGRTIGAAILTLPVEQEPPAAVWALAEGAWRELGEPARARYDTYASASNLFAALPPHHHLNMIGVRPAFAGMGFARPLLDAVRGLAQADPASAGVSLTTELPRNVSLYQHCGYEIVAHAQVAPGLETWGMFLAL